MKTLLSALVVLAMVCPVYADTIVFQEDFNGTAGNAVAGWNGWTGSSGINISDTVIDQGNSAAWSSVSNWTTIVGKAFTPIAGATQYTFTGTLSMGNGATGNYSDLRILNVSGTFVAGQLGYGVLQLCDDGNHAKTMPQKKVMDVKIVLTNNKAEGWGREHGVSEWTYMGALTWTSGYELSGYNDIKVLAHGTGGMDSILSTETVVPEPSTLALLTCGLAGLLCYAWRKRK